MSGNVLIIGAQGVLGSFISTAFKHAGWNVIRAGRRPEQADDFRLVDASDPQSVCDACEGADVVISTAYNPQLTVERAVLESGRLMIDLVELSGAERTRLSEETSGALGLVVCDTGIGGVSYLTVADLLEQCPDADEARYSLMLSASGSSGRAGAVFAHTVLTATAHRPVARIHFPDPIGSRRCFEVGGTEDSRLPTTIAGVPARHYICMQPPALQRLLLATNALRCMPLLPRISFTAGKRRVPSVASDEPICEWMAVARNGQLLASRTVEGRGSYRMTATATLVFAESLVKRPAGDRPRGLLSITDVLRLSDVRSQLESREIAIVDGGRRVTAADLSGAGRSN